MPLRFYRTKIDALLSSLTAIDTKRRDRMTYG
ncbi:uncharacterized protein METZ01_LOCUS309830, partial [marine metagenome]